ncbi:MAG: DUF3536 domain-containing protein [Zestosphaera sp.]
MRSGKYVTIHAHFYQPPREDPWLGQVLLEDSAYPYHDWNERITEECYRPNSLIPIVNSENYVVDVINNYSWISFNVGPTLLKWLEARAPDVYEAMMEADYVSRERFSGHGSAIAQIYNHMIMPLARREDKYLATYWGVEAFREAFKRPPEGMWLPETAVDDESLDVLAELGVKFTVLAPHQASKVRALDGEWVDVSGGRVDSRKPYLYRTSSGRTITIFFYDACLSHGVAFGDLLSNGETLATSILKAFSSEDEVELVTVATDGETYGHHKRHGHLALAYAIRTLNERSDVRITNFGEFLERNPPTHEVKVVEKSSWSCPHGVERWRSDCGCRVDPSKFWSQGWRTPLREAVDWLGSETREIYLSKAPELLNNPVNALMGYVSVMGESEGVVEDYLKKFSDVEMSQDVKVRSLKLLEMMKHSLLMYASDGWFFDDISNIESIQVMRHAARAIELANEFTNEDLEGAFLKYLSKASSNVPELKDGENIYKQLVKSASVDHLDICILFAMLNLVNGTLASTVSGGVRRVFNYVIINAGRELTSVDGFTAVLGRARVKSLTTLEACECVYYAHTIKGQVIIGASAPAEGRDLRLISGYLTERVNVHDLEGVRETLRKHFVKVKELSELPKDFQLYLIENAPGMLHVVFSKTPFLNRLRKTTKLHITPDTLSLDPLELRYVLTKVIELGVELPSLMNELDVGLSEQVRELIKAPGRLATLEDVRRCVLVLRSIAGGLNTLRELWRTRATVCQLGRKYLRKFEEESKAGEKRAYEWILTYNELSDLLGVRCVEDSILT